MARPSGWNKANRGDVVIGSSRLSGCMGFFRHQHPLLRDVFIYHLRSYILCYMLENLVGVGLCLYCHSFSNSMTFNAMEMVF